MEQTFRGEEDEQDQTRGTATVRGLTNGTSNVDGRRKDDTQTSQEQQHVSVWHVAFVQERKTELQFGHVTICAMTTLILKQSFEKRHTFTSIFPLQTLFIAYAASAGPPAPDTPARLFLAVTVTRIREFQRCLQQGQDGSWGAALVAHREGRWWSFFSIALRDLTTYHLHVGPTPSPQQVWHEKKWFNRFAVM